MHIGAFMRHLTVRDVPADLARALDRERKRRGWSLNRTVKELLRIGLGIGPEPERGNGLRKLAGGWSEGEARAFEEATAVFEQTDEELWR
jgi:hypothetical protein